MSLKTSDSAFQPTRQNFHIIANGEMTITQCTGDYGAESAHAEDPVNGLRRTSPLDQTKGMTMARIEKDFLGEKELPDNAYYGVQTLRGRENFHITGIPMSAEP